jgi:hypothetical protein
MRGKLILEVMGSDLFEQAYRRGLRRRLWRWLTGGKVAMKCLPGEGGGSRGSGQHAGLQTVSIARIRGSEGRRDGFDGKFLPLHRQDRRRWVELCYAWLDSAVLPPVELIQVGYVYYVRDGHHRVSVARALGQEQIDAHVTV